MSSFPDRVLGARFRRRTASGSSSMAGAALVASQLVGLAVTRYAVRLAPLTAADDGELADWVAPVLQYYLTGVPYRLKEQP